MSTKKYIVFPKGYNFMDACNNQSYVELNIRGSICLVLLPPFRKIINQAMKENKSFIKKLNEYIGILDDDYHIIITDVEEKKIKKLYSIPKSEI